MQDPSERRLPGDRSGELAQDLPEGNDSRSVDEQVTLDHFYNDRQDDLLDLHASPEDPYALAGLIAEPTHAELADALDSALAEYDPLARLF